MIRTMCPPCYSFGLVSQNEIKLKGANGEVVAFPTVIKEISRTIKNIIGNRPLPVTPIPVPNISTDTLVLLSNMVHLTTSSDVARDLNGKPASTIVDVYQVTDRYPKTILVNSLVQYAIDPFIKAIPDKALLDLYLATNFLEIPSLLNATALFIADRSIDSVGSKETELIEKEEYKDLSDIDLLWEAVKHVFPLSDELVTRIAKYVYLDDLEELTIADYIGMHGLSVVVNNEIDLQDKSITGLSGMELISADETTKVNLMYNSILGHHLDIDFPPRPFRGFEKLQTLWLSYNYLGTLPKNVFGGLGRLKDLWLFDNHLSTLPEGVFGGLRSLESLHLENNNLIKLPEGVFGGLGKLERLSLNSNHLIKLPEGVFGGLGSLRVLKLENNHLIKLPEGVFGGLRSLESLHLFNNNLSTLPEGVFGGLRSLEWLNLDNNNLSTLPEGVFGELGRLQKLGLFNNNLSTLPVDVFGGLRSLEELMLSANNLSTLPEGVFDGLGSLVALLLNSNHLSTLPEGVFGGLRSLVALLLNSNHLSTLPKGIFGGLRSLEVLKLDANNLSTLPEGVFGGLGRLQDLWLSNNNLSTLPKGVFGGLRSFLNLEIGHNHLPGDRETFKQDYDIPDNVIVEFDPQTPLSASVHPYTHSCGCVQTAAYSHAAFYPLLK